jgi:hypothetical protein
MAPGSTDEDYYLGRIKPISRTRGAQEVTRTRGAQEVTEDAR